MVLPNLLKKNGIDSQEYEAPDGGWGWMVAVGVAAMFMVTLTPDSCFGLIFGDFLEDVGAGTAFVTTGVSVCVGSAAALGLIMNYALNTFTCRQVGVTGSIIYFCGSFLTAFATNVYQIIITYGILQGIGLGLMVPAAFTSFNHYFVQRRTFAMAVTQLIIGVGAMIIPLIIQKLLEEYGFRGTQAIIAAFSLHAMLGMIVQQPVKHHMKRRTAPIEFIKRPSCDVTIHEDKDWRAKLGEDSEVNIKIAQHSSRVRKESEVNITIHQSDPKATRKSRAVSQELINIHLQKGSISLDSSDAVISVGVLNETTSEEETKHESDKHNTDSRPNEGTNDDDARETPETNFPDEHKLLMHGGHSQRYGHVEHVTAEIGITVKRTGSAAVPILTHSNSHISISSLDKKRPQHKMAHTLSRKEEIVSQEGCDRCWTAVVDFLDLRLLLDPVYVNISVGISFSLICMLQFFAFYPILVLDLGFSKSDTAVFIAVCNALDLAGRVVIAFIGILYPSFSSRSLFMVGTVITVAGRLVLILFNDFLAVALMTGFLGFARSFIQVPLPLVFAEYNLERFPSAFGLYSVIFGLIAVMVGPFTGLVRDITNSYPICINTLNGLTFFACILPWMAEHAIVHMKSKTKEVTVSS